MGISFLRVALVLVFLLHAGPGWAARQATVVLAVGNNTGFADDVPLRYAEEDARRIAAVFREYGSPTRVELLTGEGAQAVQTALGRLRRAVADLRGRGVSVLFIVYYSGHGDGDFLRMAQSRLTWAKYKELVEQVRATTSISMIDACQSGSAAVAKRATIGPAFAAEWQQTASTWGSVWLASARPNEASYESDEVGGSLFSHYIVSGLRGGADLNGDRQITLSELYRYSYDNTVGKTSLSHQRTQHPTYRFDLKGEGELVLTSIATAKTTVVFSRDIEGTYYLARQFGSSPNVVEVRKARGALMRVGASPGSYVIYRKDPDRIWIAAVQIREGEELVFDPRGLRPRAYRDVLSKGGRISLSSWRAFVAGSVVRPVVAGADVSYLVGPGLSWRGQRFGLLGHLGLGHFAFQAVDTEVANLQIEGALRAEVFWELRWLTVSASAGINGLILWQQPRGGPTIVTASPGLVVGLAAERALWAKTYFSAEIGGGMWLTPRDKGLELHLRPQGTLVVGYRFR